MRNALILVGALCVAACSHNKELPPGEKDLGGGVSETVNGDEVKKAFDLNGDGKPDAYEIYKKVKDEKGKESVRLIRKEFDLNGDGKIDFWRWYDEKEQLEKEANDLDFNGTVDTITYFEHGEKTKEERDFDANNQPHMWIYYERNQIARKERDTHNRGKPDYWEYWENGVLDRIAMDKNGDGQVDFWEKNPDTQQPAQADAQPAKAK